MTPSLPANRSFPKVSQNERHFTLISPVLLGAGSSRQALCHDARRHSTALHSHLRDAKVVLSSRLYERVRTCHNARAFARQCGDKRMVFRKHEKQRDQMRVIFAGLTLFGADVRPGTDYELRPPARQGDVHRAIMQGANVIGLIDGIYEHVPAIWHTRILFGLSHGVHIFGAASMGALRAAERAAFGMVGIGEIWRSLCLRRPRGRSGCRAGARAGRDGLSSAKRAARQCPRDAGSLPGSFADHQPGA